MGSSRRDIRKPVRKRSARRRPSERPPAPNELEVKFAAELAGHNGPVAVAVSGGGDSLALMHLLAGFARAGGMPAPVVLTVDHGLRKKSAEDAQAVAAWAKKAGLKAHVLVWRGKKPKSGIEALAREARYRLMGDWMASHGIATLFVGHTEDDQAETFLLRLARGSGLDGLSAMRAHAPWPVEGFSGLSVARPLLATSRAALREYLRSRDQDWLEDPMNQDTSCDRVRNHWNGCSTSFQAPAVAPVRPFTVVILAPRPSIPLHFCSLCCGKVPGKVKEYRKFRRACLAIGVHSRLRHKIKTLNLLMAGNTLQPSYLLGAGDCARGPWAVPRHEKRTAFE